MLIVLDLNRVLVFRVFKSRTSDFPGIDAVPGATVVGQFLSWKRPHLEKFLDFLFDNFAVGVWSSAMQKNVNLVGGNFLVLACACSNVLMRC